MKLQTTKTENVELEVKVPSFYKLDSPNVSFLAIISERDVLEVFESDGLLFVTNKDAKSDTTSKQIKWAIETGEEVPEEEFFNHYNRVLHSLSLTPELITKP